MGGACSTYVGAESVYMVLIRKPEGKIPLGRPRHRRLIILKSIYSISAMGAWNGLMFQNMDR
jgi:hypothetical protein